MYKYTHVDRDLQTFPYIESGYGFNDMPKPFTEITHKEWFTQTHMWAFEYYDYKQVMNKQDLVEMFGEDVGYAEAYIEFGCSTGFAEVIKRYGNKTIIKYFRIGCQHDWELIQSDSISYTQKCKKCGTVREVPTGR
jgi:hypothetical protein